MIKIFLNNNEHTWASSKRNIKKYGATVPDGVYALTVQDLIEKAKSLKTEKFVLKAQIHAGGRGKAGGVKILDTLEDLAVAAKIIGKIGYSSNWRQR